MKQLCIIGQDYSGTNIIPGSESSFTLEGVPLRFGIIETDDIGFDADAPENADQVHFRVTAFSCNYRDRAFALRMKEPKFSKSYFVLGSDFVGEVIAVGRNVTRFKPGDRVIADGAYPYSGVEGVMPGIPTNQGSRELQTLHQCKLIQIPDSMSDAVAGGFSIGGQTAYSMVRRLNLQPGENVLVTGAKSNTSLYAISALKNYGVNTYAISRSQKHADKLEALGVDRLITVDPSQKGWSLSGDMAQCVMEIGGFDAMVDPFSDVYLAEIPNILAIGGRHITCGVVDQHTHLLEQEPIVDPVDASRLMGMVLARNISIIGNCLGQTSDLQHAIDDYAGRKLDVPVYANLGVQETGQFFEKTYLDTDRFGKVVLDYNKDAAKAGDTTAALTTA
ncbi:zinc-binding alcohol dehydrogenase family protein [Ruegeria sp. 2205SS24-7]|uniref:quinone oxidoreductase family protein n=1 Tax=Ruegeria discodermiae TaxID=3064389 RepID=UPI002740A8CF|nr:zinc-binding alcohol dehydrogenase family protein [Ruegeria sp. 2205SS24-7]MDP5219150.1 zinc-binding alcohol dehydrogenase family protein [Ruegeria sp. 2205SS24-7]